MTRDKPNKTISQSRAEQSRAGQSRAEQSVFFTSKTNKWETPQWLFDRLNRIFEFEIDVCADESNHKCAVYYTEEDDGLKQDWHGKKVWCNPPYGRQIQQWVAKAAETVKDNNSLVVMLIPARVDTSWYHDYISNNPQAHTVFIRGRLQFGESHQNAPFPSMIVVFA